MKKNIFLCSLSAIAGIAVGFSICLMMQPESPNSELLDAQNACLEQAEKVMWNNDLFDADGSDDMADYLELACKVDSLWNN